MPQRIVNLLAVGMIILGLVAELQKGDLARTWITGWQVERNAKRLVVNSRQDIFSVGQWLGPKDTMRFIVVLSDYECPFCRQAEDSLERLEDEPGAPGVLLLHYPLSSHAAARPAASAALCADEQARGAAMHRLLMRETDWRDGMRWRQMAERVGVPAIDQFMECLGEAATARRLDRMIAIGGLLPVSATPTFLGNGGIHVGVPNVDQLRALAPES